MVFFLFKERGQRILAMLGQNTSFSPCTSVSQFAHIPTLYQIFFSLSLFTLACSSLSLNHLFPLLYLLSFLFSFLFYAFSKMIPYRDSSHSHFVSPNTSLPTKIPSSLPTYTHLLSHLSLFPFSQLTPFQCDWKEREGERGV